MTSLQPTSIPSASSTIMTSITVTNHREKLASLVKERRERIQQNHVKAEEHAKSGDELFENENYLQASYFYSDAVKLWNTNVDFHVKLATAYVKANQYEQAAFIATRALTMNPKLLEARYQRGLARLEQGLFEAARIDFTTILAHAPSHQLAATALTKINTSMTSQGTSQGGSRDHTNRSTITDLDFQFPAYEEVEIVLAELSESEECGHVGNRIPCKHYNRKDRGCERPGCPYMHAPDERSVRDSLGRNVCVYMLLGSCRFKDHCVYSHDKEWLPSKGWWTDPAQVERMKRIMALTEKNIKEKRELERQLQHVQTQDKGKRKPQNNNRGRNTNNPNGQRRHRYTRQARGRVRAQPSEGQLEKVLEQLGERMDNFGFTYDEVDELMCQGVKPWDDDALDVMHALSYM